MTLPFTLESLGNGEARVTIGNVTFSVTNWRRDGSRGVGDAHIPEPDPEWDAYLARLMALAEAGFGG